MSHRQSPLEQVLDSSSSDEEDQFFCDVAQIVHNHYQSASAPKHGGSVVGHKLIDREREEGHWRLHQDYFADEPTYGPIFFRRRFVFSTSTMYMSSIKHDINFIFLFSVQV